MRSEYVKEILDRHDDEYFLNKRREYIKSLTAEYQLGVQIGNIIASKYLPTLSVDLIYGSGKKIIQVSAEDTAEHDRLDEEWKNTCKFFGGTFENGDPEKFKALRNFSRSLARKYLSSTLVCTFDALNIIDEKEFLKGVWHSIWNCDYSWYINPELKHDEHLYNSYIYLTLDADDEREENSEKESKS